MRKIFVSVLTAISVVSVLSLTGCKKEEPSKTAYLASEQQQIPIYIMDENKNLVEDSQMVRGSALTIKGSPYEIEETGKIYEPFKTSDEKDAITYYVDSENLSDSPENVVKETTRYVRTPLTIYSNAQGPDISGFAKKGTLLNITGYDTLNEDGSVVMYQVSSDSGSGYVYSKYLAETEEEANAVNQKWHDLNKDKVYSIELYGGSPANLDYFVYEKKVEKKADEIPSEARTYYLNAEAVLKNEDGSYAVDEYINTAKQYGANALVIDIKDGYLAYDADVAKEYTMSSYEGHYLNKEDYKESIKRIKDAGLWAIGRIVVFNDEQFANDNPDECIYFNGTNQGWPSAFSRKAWEYNVKLAVSAVEEMGFDEIQFDYVRFPENTYFMESDAADGLGTVDFKNTYGEEKAQAIQNFCMYAADSIHKAGAYFSVDVFGECSNGYVTAYGQYWPAISNVVDAISSMPYVDHFGRDTDTWSDSYTTVYNWAVQAAQAQEITPNPAIPRTWLTCYAVPYWDPVIPADSAFLGQQIQALWDAGIGHGGFITWNAASGIYTYGAVGEAFSRTY